MFEYQYIPVDVFPQELDTIAENGEFSDMDEVAAEGQNEVTKLVVNYTSSSMVAENSACFYVLSPGVSRHESLLFNTYYWFRVVCVHIVPCTSLVVLNSALVGAIRTAQLRRSELLRRRTNRTNSEGGGTHLLRFDNNRASTSGVGEGQRRTGSARVRRLPEGSSTTMMLVIVVGVFLLVETPLAVFLVVMIAENTFGASILTTESRDSASLYLNLFTLVSYPVNFFIYCAMSEQFRRTFCGLFTSSAASVAAAVTAPGALCGSENNDENREEVQMSPLDPVEMVCSVDANCPAVVEHQINNRQ